MFTIDRTPEPREDHRDREEDRAWLRLLRPLSALVVIIAIGTIGYILIEGWPLLDALYMALITLSTVGHGAPGPLSEGGRAFTIALIIAAVGVAGYALSQFAVFIFEGEFNRALRGTLMHTEIDDLTNHIIVCGAGRTGIRVVEELAAEDEPFVVIEQDPDSIEQVRQLADVLYVQGDATRDETLREAGIERARALVAALGDDKDNLFIIVSANSLNPDLRIIARVNHDKNADKLRRAGADETISPAAIGGQRMASTLLRPTVVAFVDEMMRMLDDPLQMEELSIGEMPALHGKTLAEAGISQETGVLVVAIKREEDDFSFNPGADTELRDGDTLIVMGTSEQVASLKTLASS